MARKPFFMRFVEKTPEQPAEVRTDVKAGVDGGPRRPYVTLKWPSDDDEYPTY